MLSKGAIAQTGDAIWIEEREREDSVLTHSTPAPSRPNVTSVQPPSWVSVNLPEV